MCRSEQLSYCSVPTYVFSEFAAPAALHIDLHYNIFMLEQYAEVYVIPRGTAVAQWLRCCATNRKVAGSIPDGIIGIFH
jgi:hypothetical protein